MGLSVVVRQDNLRGLISLAEESPEFLHFSRFIHLFIYFLFSSSVHSLRLKSKYPFPLHAPFMVLMKLWTFSVLRC